MQADEYIRTFALQDILVDGLQCCVREMPEDPYEYLSAFFLHIHDQYTQLKDDSGADATTQEICRFLRSKLEEEGEEGEEGEEEEGEGCESGVEECGQFQRVEET